MSGKELHVPRDAIVLQDIQGSKPENKITNSSFAKTEPNV
jgi:hypothetical protein